MNWVHTEAGEHEIGVWDFSSVNASVLWDCGGEIRLMPWPLIRNARQLWESWNEAVTAGIIDEIPAAAQVIKWECCLGLPAGSGYVKVAEDPRLQIVKAEGNSGADGTNH